MAGHILFRIGLSLLTHTSHIAKWLQTYDPFVTTEDTPTGGSDPGWAAPTLRQIVPAITSVFTSPNSKTVVVLGETSEATVALFQLAREFSPELVFVTSDSFSFLFVPQLPHGMPPLTSQWTREGDRTSRPSLAKGWQEKRKWWQNIEMVH